MLDLLGDPRAWGRVAVSTVLVYAAMVALLRVGGNRALASMRAYDFVLVVAVGTLVSSAALTQVPLGNALVAIVLLVGLQVGVAMLARRRPSVERALTSAPVLVAFEGRLVDEGLRDARLTREEVLLGLRSKGYRDVADVGAAVLETNGSLSVLPRGEKPAGALENVGRAGSE